MAERADDAEDPAATPPRQATPLSTEFDWRGWVLVGVVALSFLVIPGAVLFLPEARSLVANLGLTLRDAYLALPMVTAILLGATAVWAALHARRE